MAYPPSVPAGTRTNTTPQVTTHPDDHNTIAAALTDIINVLGSAPAVDSASVQAFLELIAPIDEVKWVGGTTAPSGWAVCDGTAVSRTTYPKLFARLGTTYGAGDGSTTFNLPDLQDRYVIGKSGTVAVGDVVGSNDAVVVEHGHTIAHTHQVDPPSTTTSNDTHNHTYSNAASAGTGIAGGTTFGGAVSNTGNDTHNHTVDIAAFTSGGSSANDTGTAGVSGTNANRPESLGLLPIIRLA